MELIRAGPPIRYVTPKDLLARLRRIPQESIPVMRGDWTDYWCFGLGNAAYKALSAGGPGGLEEGELLAAGRAPRRRPQRKECPVKHGTASRCTASIRGPTGTRLPTTRGAGAVVSEGGVPTRRTSLHDISWWTSWKILRRTRTSRGVRRTFSL